MVQNRGKWRSSSISTTERAFLHPSAAPSGDRGTARVPGVERELARGQTKRLATGKDQGVFMLMGMAGYGHAQLHLCSSLAK